MPLSFTDSNSQINCKQEGLIWMSSECQLITDENKGAMETAEVILCGSAWVTLSAQVFLNTTKLTLVIMVVQ